MSRKVINSIVILAEHLANGLELVWETSLADTEDRFFGLINDVFQHAVRLIGQTCDPTGRVQEPPSSGCLLHHMAVGFCVDG